MLLLLLLLLLPLPLSCNAGRRAMRWARALCCCASLPRACATSAVADMLLLLPLLLLLSCNPPQGNALGKGPVLLCLTAKGLRHLSCC
jgi:hypothetical protein